ncbi:MAG: DMT family transporter [Beijerinckiaceae bacterium]
MNPLFGIALKVASTLAFAMMAACVRHLAQRYPVGEVVFTRSFFALIPVIAWLAWQKKFPEDIFTRHPWQHFRRGLIGSCGMFLGFLGLAYLPLPDATALGYAAPLMVVVLAALVVKEVVRIYRWTAVAVGFIGVLVMLWPHLQSLRTGFASNAAALGVAFTLGSTLTNAFATVEVRRLVQLEERTGTIVFWMMMSTTVLGFLTLFWGWTWPTPQDAALMVLMGILGGIGQILVTESYHHADTSLIAPFDYTSMIWAVIIGWFLFGEWPAHNIIIGAAIVIAAGLFVIWREHRLGIERKKARQAQAAKIL